MPRSSSRSSAPVAREGPHLRSRAAEATRIDAWWRSERASAPDVFARELIDALELLATSPEMGMPYGIVQEQQLRRVFLQHTRYHVYYVIRDDVVDVLSVWASTRGRTPRFRKH